MSDLRRTVTVIPAKPQISQAAKRQLRVAAYCRVSTDMEEQQSSYEAQCTYYTEKIMTNPDWTMAGIYADEGITGTSTKNREDFKRMIRHCKQKKIDLILTKSISRFSRNTVDCLNYIRALKAMGIAVFFEKENINTMSTDSELIITLMGAFAQSESESISANIKWGRREAMREGKARVSFSKLYGYCMDDRDNPSVDEEKAEVIRDIYRQFLKGASTRMIKKSLDDRRIPSPSGRASWDTASIRSILSNEKYCGDVLMQKTFIQDCISKKVVKNTGQLPMYLIRNNHPPIVTREMFQAVQAELARRTSAPSPSTKYAPTGRTCYASKYALSERLVCGECGTLYRRCTWSRNGQKRIMWRCVSRLDYGTKYCHESPSMEETALQEAIMAAINSVMSPKEILIDRIKDSVMQELVFLPDATAKLEEIRRRLRELEDEFRFLLEDEESRDEHTARFQEISEETAALKVQREELAHQLRGNVQVFNRLQNATTALGQANHHMTEWSEETIRQLVHTVKVISADRIRVYLYDGVEIEKEVRKP